jgi:predicted HicB family RNase H-like nuclease
MVLDWCYTGTMKNINLRLDDELHGRLKHIADLDRRSLQQEIIYLLNRAYDEHGQDGDETAEPRKQKR